MKHETLGERLSRIEDELAGLDSALDARTRLLWQAVNEIRALVVELRDQYARARAGVTE